MLYICSKRNGSNKPSFFHYDRFDRKTRTNEKSVKKIISLDYTSSKVVMKFEDGSYATLLNSPLWMKRGGLLNLEEDCILSIGGSSSSNQLSCKYSGSSIGDATWQQNIWAII